MQYFISAIGTDSGKTLVSAIFTEALKADYWKPVQAGFPRDTETVQSLVTNGNSVFHSEGYLLNTPASPHAAAKIDSVDLAINQLQIPKTENTLIVEGAGGLMVPLNDSEFIVDMPLLWRMPVILVSNLYLGSINHTLLSVDNLKHQGIEVKGIVFNGTPNPESEDIILKYSGFKQLLRIPQLKKVNREVVRKLGDELLKNWND